MQTETGTKRKFDYKWVIVALCFIMIFICLGFCSSNKGLYLSAMTEALGIKRSVFSIGDSIRYIATAIVNIFFGTLVSRFGTKKLIGAGFVCLILACLFYAYSTGLIGIYIAGALLGMGFSWTTTTMVGCVVNAWCRENKGTIMGAVLAANGIGGAVAAQILSPIIYREGTLFGYRDAYVITAGILLTVAVIMMIFYKDKPQEVSGGKAEENKAKASEIRTDGIPINEAVKKGYFYCTALCIFFTGMILQGITGIAAAHMNDVGMDMGFVATVVSIHSLTLAGAKFLSGVMYDRLGLRITVAVCDVAAVFAMLTLAILTESAIGRIYALIYGVLSSLALPLETIMLPIFANDLFGARSFNKILGIFVSVNTAGYAVGVPLMNWVFDVWGSYKPALIIMCGAMLVITVAFQFILTVAKKAK